MASSSEDNHVHPVGSDSLEALPFLVTHWLANYQASEAALNSNSNTNTNAMEEADANSNASAEKRREALEKIRSASADIAAAFSSLGAFGTSRSPSLMHGSSSISSQSNLRQATYSDARRRWSALPPSHLETMANAVASNNNAAVQSTTLNNQSNLVEASCERREVESGSEKAGNSGRTANDAITVETEKETEERIIENSRHGLFVLHPPIFLTAAAQQESITTIESSNMESSRSIAAPLHARSSFIEFGTRASTTMRKILNLREKIQTTKEEMRNLRSSIEKQKVTVQHLDDKYKRLAKEGNDMKELIEVSEEVKVGKRECERVTAQLQRKLSDMSIKLQNDETQLNDLDSSKNELIETRSGIVRTASDPYWSWGGQLAPNSRIGAYSLLRTILDRQHGASRPNRLNAIHHSSIRRGQSHTHFAATRKALLTSRLSHAATINAHLSYPVYCLRFDRTGRYFISGADDYLIKVFHLGSGKSCFNINKRDRSRQLRCNYGANAKGATLVCSLRGHAGVINDIDVSSDNAFLASASVDGDVRVWGLRDGSPIAILRGHKGGANMVSWSKLTPYRLITTGSDGFARLWDVRDACLKRYGSHIGKRPEYLLKLTPGEAAKLDNHSSESSATIKLGSPLPAIPPRESEVTGNGDASVMSSMPSSNAAARTSTLEVPPLPAAVPPLPIQNTANGRDASSNVNGQSDNIAPGSFIANDEIDEGVTLVKKLKHGTIGPEINRPGTRARSAAVNVICVARSPLGTSFATGSDDGICRVFQDEDDVRVAFVDQRTAHDRNLFSGTHTSNVLKPLNEPILKLAGHVGAITDLAFSNAGDRILSASQKDGVVRIWTPGGLVTQHYKESAVRQIIIKLTNPVAQSSRSKQNESRRGQGGSKRGDPSKVSCDVAVWSHDDTKIITSQSLLVKQNGSEIQKGSQYIFLWNSYNGQCLIGLSGAHTMQCPVVVPHPNDASLVVTAGADGIARLWDWETGRCIFSHANKVEFGPVEASDKGKIAGYLDGSFNSDGTLLVLTDDSGRLTILDTNASDESIREGRHFLKEQYFANDYYDLFYDSSGYCVERGSERPPHLAPKGVRCDHSGTPLSAIINETFSKMYGPMPLPTDVCRSNRNMVRHRGYLAAAKTSSFVGQKAIPIRSIMREFDPSSTIMVKGVGHVRPQRLSEEQNVRNASQRSNFTSNRNESSNFDYLDYEDMMRAQGNHDDEDPDSDDEEFNPIARSQGRRINESDDSENDNDMDLEDDLEDSDAEFPPTRRNRSNAGQRRERSRRRSQQRNSQLLQVGSEDENDVQIMSTNNTPSGPFVEDYIESGHFWRMPNENVRGLWLKRKESTTAYEGRKIYPPQLGDSVVYIPKAHSETLQTFASLELPWQQFPQGSAWPVVRCCIRGLRFRFPYRDYYQSSGHNSLVAILTLQVTGIPESYGDGEFPWPKPKFTDTNTGFVFELSLFESNHCEYLLPEGLYLGRLKALEAALRARNSPEGLTVSAYYTPDNASEDSEMQLSTGRITLLQSEDERTSSNLHMIGSGFGVLQVDFDGEYCDDFSPWDLCTNNVSVSRPQLSDEDKKEVLRKLDEQCQKDEVAIHFNVGVDTERYCDYNRMVEVEMTLMMVKGRLRGDYYASKFSVVHDLRLIRDNCMKYNGSEHDLVSVARKMCIEFEDSLLSQEESAFLKDSDNMTLSRNENATRSRTIHINLRQRTSHLSVGQPNPRNEPSTQRRSSRSTLERLPSAEPASMQVSRLERRRVMPRRQTRSINEASHQLRTLRSQGSTVNSDSLTRIGEREDTTNSRSARYARRYAGTNDEGNEFVSQDNVASRQPSPGRLEDMMPNERQTRSRRSAFATSTNTPRSTRRNLNEAQRNLSESDVENDSVASSSDDESAEEPLGDAIRSTPVRRSSRNTTVARAPPQLDTDDEDIQIERTRARQGTSRRSSRRSSPPKKMPSRARGKSGKSGTKKQVYEGESSDFEYSEEEADEESEEEAVKSPRSRSRKTLSYKEQSSDFDDEELEDEDNSDSSIEEVKPKRKRAASATNAKAKRVKHEFANKRRLKQWPAISMKDITAVSKAVLAKVEEADVGGVFAEPVVRVTPKNVAQLYRQMISKPMDLETIKEERMLVYKAIKELQDDLCLMFDNCCQFNEEESDLGQLAINIRNELNTFFVEACEENGISLGRWRP